MKNKTLKLASSIAVALSFTLVTSATAQIVKNFKITPEITKSVMSQFQSGVVEVYHLSAKTVERKTFYKGQVETVDYKILTEDLAKYKPAFDEYENKVEYRKKAFQAERTVIDNITKYLETKDMQLLVESQKIIDEYKFRLKRKTDLNASTFNKYNTEEVLLQINNKPAKNSYLRSVISDVVITEMPLLEKSDDYYKYEYALHKLETTKRYENYKGKVLSDTLKSTTIYLKDDTKIDINSLSGVFSEKGYFVIVEKEVPNVVWKNQVISSDSDYYNQSTMGNFKRFLVFESSEGELYCTNNSEFLGKIENLQFEEDKKQKEKDYANIGTSVEYKNWKTKYTSVLQSCSVNMNACNAIIAKYRYKNVYHEWVYFPSDFSSVDKIAFKKNIDSLGEKIKKLSEMEDSYSPDYAFYNYYTDHASTEEAMKSYKASQYYNSNRVY